MGIRTEFAVQVRSEESGCHTVQTIKQAMRLAAEHEDIWKISFDAENGERVRLVRDELTGFWVYENILEILQDILPCEIDEAMFLKED